MKSIPLIAKGICPRLFFLILLCIHISATDTHSQVQLKVEGRVVDAATSIPLSNVSVYLANTLMGSATDNNGNFTIYNVPPGTYDIIAAHIGYEIRTRRVRLVRGRLQKYNFRLSEKTLESEEVLVVGTVSKEWQKNLKRFSREFLGTTQNARECRIVNPEILSFEYDDDTHKLTAHADGLLIVENHALGYRISLMIEYFSVDKSFMRYTVKPYFELMQPENESTQAKFEKNRAGTFYGSQKHFLSALSRGMDSNQNFFVYPEKNLPAEISLTTKDIPPNNIDTSVLLQNAEMPFEHVLKFDDILRIIYTGKVVDREYALSPSVGSPNLLFPESLIMLSSGQTLMNSLGHVYDAETVISFGYWSTERIADLLPFEYNPLYNTQEGNIELRNNEEQENTKTDSGRSLKHSEIKRHTDKVTAKINESLPFVSPDSIKTGHQYLTSLDHADSQFFLNTFKYPFMQLLSGPQLKHFEELKSEKEQKDFIKLFWRMNNANPVSSENQNLVNFIRRWQYVRKNFPLEYPPYFDDRGKFYLKYGKPLNRFVGMGGPGRVTFLTSMRPLLKITDAPNRGQLSLVRSKYVDLYPDPGYMVYPNETWSYEKINREFVVHFVNEGSQFRQVSDLAKAIKYTTLSKETGWYWTELVKERIGISPLLDETINDIEDKEGRLRNWFELGGTQVSTFLLKDINPAKPEIALQGIRQDLTALEKNALNSAPPALINSEEMNILQFSRDIAQFRDPDGKTRLEIAMLAPYKDNLIRYEANTPGTHDINFTAMVRNALYLPVVSKNNSVPIPVRPDNILSYSNAAGFISLLVPRGKGELVLEVCNNTEYAKGFSKEDINVRNFTGNELMISDIQLLINTDDTKPGWNLPVFNREGVDVSPYPFQNIDKSIPAACYFEIYNLNSVGIGSVFTMQIEANWDTERESAAKRLKSIISGQKKYAMKIAYNRTINSNTSFELLSLDFEDLASGPYILSIKILDPAANVVYAHAEKKIFIK